MKFLDINPELDFTPFSGIIMLDIQGDRFNNTITLLDEEAIKIIQEKKIPYANPRIQLPIMVDIQGDRDEHTITLLGKEAEYIINNHLPHRNVRQAIVPIGNALLREIECSYEKRSSERCLEMVY